MILPLTITGSERVFETSFMVVHKKSIQGNQKCNGGRNWRHVSCTCTRSIVQGFIRGLTTFATFGLTGATYNYAYRNRFDVISAILLYRKI